MIKLKTQPDEVLKFVGKFHFEQYRNGKLIRKIPLFNTVTTDGKNNIFNIMFGGATQLTAWYIGLIDNTGYSTNAVTDTMAAHAGWVEWTSYNETTRQSWTPAAASSGSVTNTTAATFTMNASGTLRGIFITSVNTKGGTTGVLWSGGIFAAGTVAVTSGDQIKITYTLSA